MLDAAWRTKSKDFVEREMRKDPKKVTHSLYHYTTAHGLIGILEQKKIWATHINYLNDKKEFIDAVEKLKEKIENLRPEVRTPYDDVPEFLQIMKTMVYVTAFSEDGDQLNQWRGYCANGAGFSIGFNLAKLRQLLKRTTNTIVLKKCIYNPRIKRQMIDRIIEAAESTSQRREKFSTLATKMMEIAPYFKDESFKEEKEWRLALIGGGENLFREGNTLIIPYVEFDLKDENGNLPVDNIWIGPTSNMEESHASLQMLLMKHKLSASIEKSHIPYRPGL